MAESFGSELQYKLVELVLVVAATIAMGLLGSLCVRVGIKAQKLERKWVMYAASGAFFLLLRLSFAAPPMLLGDFKGQIFSIPFLVKVALAFIYGITILYFYRVGKSPGKGRKSSQWLPIFLWAFVTYFYRGVFF